MLEAAPFYGRKMVFVVTNRKTKKRFLSSPGGTKTKRLVRQKRPLITNLTMVMAKTLPHCFLAPPSARDWLALHSVVKFRLEVKGGADEKVLTHGAKLFILV